MSRPQHSKPGRGAVAIIVENEQFLVIRRSATVRAPNQLCFAGGTIEVGETPEQTIVRELKEELNLDAVAREHVWQSETAWGTVLDWVWVDRDPDSLPQANPDEVSEWMWIGASDLLARPDVLPSVPAFFVAWARGEFTLPPQAGTPDPSWNSEG